MEILIKPRGSGKTTELIKKSCRTGYPIIVGTYTQQSYIKNIAKQIGMEIPIPIVFPASRTYFSPSFGLNKTNKYLVDDSEYLLSAIIGVPIDTMTIGSENCITSLTVKNQDLLLKEYTPNYLINKDSIKNVIFNNPATIVEWKDGTKTVVKCQNGDIFNKEQGLAMCIAKKVFGNKSNYNEVFAKWVEKNES